MEETKPLKPKPDPDDYITGKDAAQRLRELADRLEKRSDMVSFGSVQLWYLDRKLWKAAMAEKYGADWETL